MSAFAPVGSASYNATQKYANQVTSLDSAPVTIVYPNKDGSTGGSSPNYTAPNSSSDAFGGTPIASSTPISINTGLSAEGLQSLSYALSGGFDGLMDLISKTTDKNNAWSAKQAQDQMAFQERMTQNSMEFNSLEAAKNREWQEMMSNTAHQREVADLKAAGLNPVLSASGGNGAAVGSGATAAGVQAPSGAKGETDESGNMALASMYGALLNAQTQMANANLSAKTNLQIAAMQQEANMYASQLAADASKYAAGTNYAAAQYSADKNFQNNEAQRQWNADHPSNAYQAASSLVGGNSGVSSAKAKASGYWAQVKEFGSDVMHWIFDR